MTAPILSRFDLLAVVKDDADEEYDDALATFVINSHMKNHPNIIKRTQLAHSEGKSVEEQTQELQVLQEQLDQMLLPNNRMNNQRSDLIPHTMLKKYLIYSRRFIRPKLSEIDQNKITQFYSDIRRESNLVGGIPIAVRHIESVIRMAEAWAKLHLRDYVRSDDIDNAIEMLLDSFLQSQKNSVSRQLAKKFEKYRHRQQDSNQLLLHTLRKVVQDRVSTFQIPYAILGSIRQGRARAGDHLEDPCRDSCVAVPNGSQGLRSVQPAGLLQIARVPGGVQDGWR